MYLITNKYNNVLYVGVTSDIKVRTQQHKSKYYPASFTAKYNCNKLVYFECFSNIEEAIAREKNIKKWKRAWKNELINKVNPKWDDLSNVIEEY